MGKQTYSSGRSIKQAAYKCQFNIKMKIFMRNYIAIRSCYLQLIIGLLALMLNTSCRQDDTHIPVGKSGTAEVTFTLQIPGFRDFASRAGVQEEKLNDITVLLYANESGTEKLKVKQTVAALRIVAGTTAGTAKFSIIITQGTYTRAVLVANAQTELNALSLGTAYTQLKQIQAVGRQGRKGGTATDSYIPMYGEYAPAGGIKMTAGESQTIAQEIPLIRMMARVDIINLPTSGAALTGNILFVNPTGNGIIHVDPTSYNTGAGYMAPILPATLQPGNAGNPLTVPAETTGATTCYLNEQPVSSSLTTSGVNRPCVIVAMNYNGRNYYYRLDYTWDGIKGGGSAPYTKGTYMPILRNHRYIFSIKEVKGPGFLTVEEALKSPENHTNLHNIVATPFVINEAFTDITFNSMGHYIAVTRTAIVLKGDHTTTSTENRFSVYTNYPTGWKMTAYQADGTPLTPSAWLTPSQTAGAANVKTEVQALTQGKGWKFGYLDVQAGRLQRRIDVVLRGKLPLEYAAEHNLAGGYQYGSSFNRALNGDPWSGGHAVPLSPTSAQTDTHLRWATSHANDQSGYYNGFVCTGLHQSTYNPGAKKITDDVFFTTGDGKNYHIPSFHELKGIFSDWTLAQYGSTVDVQDIAEAVEVGGSLQTYTSDYYSTGNGIGYALRFKKGTRHTSDEPTVPLAATNSMACAYRYERIGAMTTYLNTTDHLKVQCVYVGNQTPLPDLRTKIAQESWWNAQPPATVITRIFPAAGYISEAKPAAVSANYLRERGRIGFHWSSTLSANQYWLAEAYFTSTGVKVHRGGGTDMSSGFVIRLFSNE